MKPTISAFYQCYKQPKAFLRALSFFRLHYPESTIALVSDGGGYNYAEAAWYFHCQYQQLSERTGDMANSTVFVGRKQFIEWLGRLVAFAKTTSEEYILLLEDDVIVMKDIRSPLLFDINGANTKEFLGKNIEGYLQKLGKKGKGKQGRFYYGGCGGALFKRSFILQHFTDLSAAEKIIIEFEPYREGRHLTIYSTDYWISILTYYFDGTVGSYDGFCETWQSDFWWRKYVLKNIEVLHQAKDFYNKPLTASEKEVLGDTTI